MSYGEINNCRDDDYASVRNQGLLLSLPWIKSVARGFYYRLRFTGISFEDCVGAATLGYIESCDNSQDPSTLAFKSYAFLRMKGAVMRAAFSASDHAAQCFASHERRRERLRLLLSESGPDESIQGFRLLVTWSALGYLIDDQVAADCLISEDSNPYQQYEDLQLARLLSSAVQRLLPTQQAVIVLHYYHGLSFTEVARSLAISKARVSQLHKRGLEQLLVSVSELQYQEDF